MASSYNKPTTEMVELIGQINYCNVIIGASERRKAMVCMISSAWLDEMGSLIFKLACYCRFPFSNCGKENRQPVSNQS